jgi:hypothetical protein
MNSSALTRIGLYELVPLGRYVSELFEISVHPESQESKKEDKSSGLDIGHNQEIRTVTIA